MHVRRETPECTTCLSNGHSTPAVCRVWGTMPDNRGRLAEISMPLCLEHLDRHQVFDGLRVDRYIAMPKENR